MSKLPEDIARAFVSAINAEDPRALRTLMTDDHTFTDAHGHSFTQEDRVALFGRAAGSWRVNDIVLPQRWNVSAAWLAEVEKEKIKHWTVFCDTSWANPPR